jgi:hypothetical protein
MLKWIQETSAAIGVVLIFALVVVTAVYALLTHRIAKANTDLVRAVVGSQACLADVPFSKTVLHQ